MNPLTIHIAIAETLPRYQVGNAESGSAITSKGEIHGGEPIWQRANGWPITCPDYTESLDAIHSIEMNLSREDHRRFRLNLIAVVAKGSDDEARSIVSATAMQRCEAILLTLSNREDAS